MALFLEKIFKISKNANLICKIRILKTLKFIIFNIKYIFKANVYFYRFYNQKKNFGAMNEINRELLFEHKFTNEMNFKS